MGDKVRSLYDIEGEQWFALEDVLDSSSVGGDRDGEVPA
jgi:hypothetical protein